MSRESVCISHSVSDKIRPATPFNTPILKASNTPQISIGSLNMFPKSITQHELSSGWMRTLNVLKRDNIINQKQMQILLEED
jgi:hypothetical protein